jgi:hypothetical protein
MLCPRPKIADNTNSCTSIQLKVVHERIAPNIIDPFPSLLSSLLTSSARPALYALSTEQTGEFNMVNRMTHGVHKYDPHPLHAHTFALRHFDRCLHHLVGLCPLSHRCRFRWRTLSPWFLHDITSPGIHAMVHRHTRHPLTLQLDNFEDWQDQLDVFH